MLKLKPNFDHSFLLEIINFVFLIDVSFFFTKWLARVFVVLQAEIYSAKKKKLDQSPSLYLKFASDL